jgi:predicted RNase H-like HicB family nuclease
MKLPDFYAYPAVFTTDGDGWEASFPDIDNAFTAAGTIEQAIVEAQCVLEDIMCLREKDNDEIPAPTPLSQIESGPGDIVQIVVAVMPKTRREFAQKPVKKTLTIPADLNEAALKADINFSQVLASELRRILKRRSAA